MFTLWRIGIRICDVIGRPMDAVIARIPFVRDHVAACLVLHPMNPRYEWLERDGWVKP